MGPRVGYWIAGSPLTSAVGSDFSFEELAGDIHNSIATAAWLDLAQEWLRDNSFTK